MNRIRTLANRYVKAMGLPELPKSPKPQRLAPEKGAKIAIAYASIPLTCPTDADTINAYGRFAREINAQYQFLVSAGYKFIPYYSADKEVYPNSTHMIEDIRTHKRLRVLDTNHNHPLLSAATNYRFRAIHDVFGHAMSGWQFGPIGEYRAWQSHTLMFSVGARPALDTETLGANCYFNYGPDSHIPASMRPFPQNRAGILDHATLDIV